ncbi:polyhydroxyalkanoate synthesis repressor PhaR [Comamonas sp. Y33R10-2]|uniref:polyhydroxyalkanoate synthesis repressor PhaR n=1 Tax=Comamonas sp. Y33R10-2 TaxID=2853257 RepID=UPI001C5CBAEF|nr:polyhydroxyalkanoate synthesis repressor PhaR [Comamonas sp. Y33R10-2]QXZ10537.1 polyhydroxyalkanoate synthesis repressor PhaR [Comamonas sp. Y33R10-2]
MQENKDGEAQAAKQRLIKKYPNRRLYDTKTSSYITLAEVKHLVMGNEEVVIRDAKTNEELTRSILLQIILEEEAGGAPMFSETMLANIIRFYGHAMQGFMGAYIEKNVQMFTDFQNKLPGQSPGSAPEAWKQFMSMQPPAIQSMMGNYVEQSQTVLTQMQEQMQEQMRKQTEQMLGVFGIKR